MSTADFAEAHAGKKPGDRLQCLVVTPEKTIIDEMVDFVAIPLHDGEMGILPGRSPVIGRLGYGELRTTVGDQVRRYFVDRGFVQVRDDVVTVLTNRAIPAAAIDATTAQAELAKAQAIRAIGDLDQADRDRAIGRARALVHVATK
jgi:F-type H+-transporting ATPase subunit epsilon